MLRSTYSIVHFLGMYQPVPSLGMVLVDGSPRQPNFTPFQCPRQPNFTPFWCPQQPNFTPFRCPRQTLNRYIRLAMPGPLEELSGTPKWIKIWLLGTPKWSKLWLSGTPKWNNIWLSGTPKWSKILILKII